MSMLADVSQVEPASNNSMLLTLFVCIFDTPHIVLFLHGFFASYTKEEHVQSRQFLGYIFIFMKGSHRYLSSITLVESRFNMNSLQS
jgi:hypothetical protein